MIGGHRRRINIPAIGGRHPDRLRTRQRQPEGERRRPDPHTLADHLRSPQALLKPWLGYDRRGTQLNSPVRYDRNSGHTDRETTTVCDRQRPTFVGPERAACERRVAGLAAKARTALFPRDCPAGMLLVRPLLYAQRVKSTGSTPGVSTVLWGSGVSEMKLFDSLVVP